MKMTVLLCVALLCPLALVTAQELKPFDVKVGLWDFNVTTEISGLQIPEEQLAKMTPAQRAQMEAMLKGRAGIGGPHTTTGKVCETKETLSQAWSTGQNDKSCTRQVISSSSSKQVIHLECTHGPVKSSGDMTIERVDSEHMKGSLLMKNSGGGQATTKMTYNYNFVSSDCGGLKPGEVK